jgi:hypothetical protein
MENSTPWRQLNYVSSRVYYTRNVNVTVQPGLCACLLIQCCSTANQNAVHMKHVLVGLSYWVETVVYLASVFCKYFLMGSKVTAENLQ